MRFGTSLSCVALLLCALLESLACSSSQQRLRARPFSLKDVQLTGNDFVQQAQELNTAYLKYLELDRLLFNFYRNANISTIADPYGGWEAPDELVRGHFVGHYLSALAFTYASTGDEEIRRRSQTLVQELKRCQDAIGTGYLSAYGIDQIERLENMETPVWAPYYTIHKIMAGLLDTFEYVGEETALGIVEDMASYFKCRIDVILNEKGWEYWQKILDIEFGGMNEVLYNLYSYTNKSTYLEMAGYFYKERIWDPMAHDINSLDGNHANTHLAQAVGIARGWEVSGNGTLRAITEGFKQILDEKYTYVTGGSNVNEYWNFPANLGRAINTVFDSQGHLSNSSNGLHTEETCTQYNILKVVRHLFSWTADVRAADDYERKILNGIIGVQKPNEVGEMLYMTPLGAGVADAGQQEGYGSPAASFWCCYGTAVESFAKLGDSIYFEGQDWSPSLYIAQFFPSELQWRSQNMTVSQDVQVSSDSKFTDVTVTLRPMNSSVTPSRVQVKLRVPRWAQERSSIMVDGNLFSNDLVPGSFADIWCNMESTGCCTITAMYQMGPKLERINDYSRDFQNYYAVTWGPYVLAGLTTHNNSLQVSAATPEEWFSVAGPALHFIAQDSSKSVVFKPLRLISSERYSVYWNLTTT